MAKREFLMLSQTYDETKHSIGGWFVSTKLDGQRILWDGGVSRGLPVQEVPYANTAKDYRYVNQDIRATGLWSRNGKILRAPDSWLDKLPIGLILDGEAFGGEGRWELTSSIIKDIKPNKNDWKKIQFCVFDSPRLETLFKDGWVGSTNDLFCKEFKDCVSWVSSRLSNERVQYGQPVDDGEFEYVYSWLRKLNIENETVKILVQTKLPFEEGNYEKVINDQMEVVLAKNGEGLMVRKPWSLWEPYRSYNLLKIKKWHDSEAIVRGYVWGRKTDRGSKLLGMMGTMEVEWEGKIFEISGFDWSERKLVFENTDNDANFIGKDHPGEKVSGGIINSKFPIGSKITFRYRELTGKLIPKMAVYLRKAIDL